MKSRDDLLREAEEAERLASVVSYRRDKERLLEKAAELRRQAEEAGTRPPSPSRPGRR
jgi:hypothetical protein